jgi:hypothetical protein
MPDGNRGPGAGLEDSLADRGHPGAAVICPKCDGQLDAMAALPWGDGNQALPLAPFLCSLCASLLIVDLERNRLIDPEEILLATGRDPVSYMKQNKLLWEKIEEARRDILALPNRRKVLR